MTIKPRNVIGAMAVALLVVAGCAEADNEEVAAPEPEETEDPEVEPDEEAPPAEEDDAADVLTETRGPGGEIPTPSGDLQLTDEQIAELRELDLTAAMLWQTSSDWLDAVNRGAQSVFDEAGIELIATTNAEHSPAQQVSDIETVLARDPDIILSWPIDPVQTAPAYRQAVDAGVTIAFMSNVPEGFIQGQDYAGIVTDDLFGMGKLTADLLADAIGGSGKVGWIFHDLDAYVTNQRDNAFRTVIERDYPDIEIVEEGGTVGGDDTFDIANAFLTRTADLDGIYTPWSAAAEGVLEALRAFDREDVAVVTHDLSATIALDLAEGGSIVGIAADEASEIGRGLAVMAALAVLGEPTPEFVIVPDVGATRDNLAEAWEISLGVPLPPELEAALADD